MPTARDPLVTATALGRGEFFGRSGRDAARPHPGTFRPGALPAGWWSPTWRCRRRGSRGFTLRGKADIWSENGYGFAAEEPEGVIGKVPSQSKASNPTIPRRLKRELKGRERGGDET